MAAIEGAQFVLESDWLVGLLGAGIGLLGVLVSLFSALAWFVRATVGQAESRIEKAMAAIAQQVTDLNDRVGRLERQVDETIIPRQEKISRRLDVEE